MWVYLPWDNFATQWPCPYGFHIPTSNELTAVISAWVTMGAWVTGSWGATNFISYLKIPLAWMRQSTSWDVYGQWTNWAYKSCSAATTYPDSNSVILSFSTSFLSHSVWNQNIWWATSIRPFKNSPVTPDSSRTVLYQWTWDAWIYHNSSLWLISISSDGTTRYTIADKNLWATTVYNSWDTLSEANCGKYYQWGNNYWFPRTWSVTTSSTQVDTSWYWPWNYYSSSTFVTQNVWFTPGNHNIRWWVDGNVMIPTELKNAYIGEYEFKTKYQEVEYIQSSWTQWLNTWFTPNSNTKVQVKFALITNSWYMDVGYLSGTDLNDRRLFMAYGTNKWTVDVPWWSGSGNRLSWWVWSIGTTEEIEFWNFYIKNMANGTTYTATAVTFTWISTIKLCRNELQSLTNSDRFYYVKIFDGGTLVRDLKPCYRKSDNVIWMYDLVNNQFYTNSWTWTFTKWPDVN